MEIGRAENRVLIDIPGKSIFSTSLYAKMFNSTLSSWILSNRKVDIAFAPFIKEFVIKITPDNALEDDIYSSITLHNQAQLRDFSAVMPGLNAQIAGACFMLKGMKLEKVEGDGKKSLFKVPEAQFDGLLIFGNEEEINRSL